MKLHFQKKNKCQAAHVPKRPGIDRGNRLHTSAVKVPGQCIPISEVAHAAYWRCLVAIKGRGQRMQAIGLYVCLYDAREGAGWK